MVLAVFQLNFLFDEMESIPFESEHLTRTGMLLWTGKMSSCKLISVSSSIIRRLQRRKLSMYRSVEVYLLLFIFTFLVLELIKFPIDRLSLRA